MERAKGPGSRRMSQQRKLRRSSQRNKRKTSEQQCHRSWKPRECSGKKRVLNATKRSDTMMAEKTDCYVSQSNGCQQLQQKNFVLGRVLGQEWVKEFVERKKACIYHVLKTPLRSLAAKWSRKIEDNRKKEKWGQRIGFSKWERLEQVQSLQERLQQKELTKGVNSSGKQEIVIRVPVEKQVFDGMKATPSTISNRREGEKDELPVQQVCRFERYKN